MPERTPKQDPIHKGKANLRPQPQHLKRGGKLPRTSLTLPELEYCSWRAQGNSIIDSGRFSGMSNGLYALDRRPLIQKTINELQDSLKAAVLDTTVALGAARAAMTARIQEDLARFTHGEYITRMRRMKTHKFRGDDSIAKMMHTGLQAAGLIQSGTHVSAAAGAQAGATASANLTARRMYLPSWRKETIERLEANDERNESGVPPTAQ